MPNAKGFATRAILDDDPKSSFTCGQPKLDNFFLRHALENDRRGIGKTFVLGAPDDSLPRVSGFYTLSMVAMDHAAFAP